MNIYIDENINGAINGTKWTNICHQKIPFIWISHCPVIYKSRNSSTLRAKPFQVARYMPSPRGLSYTSIKYLKTLPRAIEFAEKYAAERSDAAAAAAKKNAEEFEAFKAREARDEASGLTAWIKANKVDPTHADILRPAWEHKHDIITLIEAGACLWEAVFTHELFEDFQEENGICELRQKVCELASTVEEAWQKHSEEYGMPFDWEFAPLFLKLCVDPKSIELIEGWETTLAGAVSAGEWGSLIAA